MSYKKRNDFSGLVNRQCIVCDANLNAERDAENDDFDNPPSGGTVWITRGNYGSSEYDPMDSNEYLETFICDKCLIEKSDRVYHVSPSKEIFSKISTFKDHKIKLQKAIDEMENK